MENNIEKEVKILDIDVEKMKELIVNHGGKLISDENQVNYILSSDKISLEKDSYLRIRVSENLITGEIYREFTYKKKLNSNMGNENLEINEKISDENALIEIMKALSFEVKHIGYKHRTSYSFLDSRLDIDIWDKNFGLKPYMEIEYTTEEILKDIIKILNIRQSQISKKSINELLKEVKK